MKLVVGIKALVINVKEDSFTGKDGKEVKTYKVAIEQNGDVASLPCTEEVFKDAKPLEQNNLLANYVESEFNGKVTKGIRVVGVAGVK